MNGLLLPASITLNANLKVLQARDISGIGKTQSFLFKKTTDYWEKREKSSYVTVIKMSG